MAARVGLWFWSWLTDTAAAPYWTVWQVVKVYVVARITPGSLKSLPKPAGADALWPPSDPKAYATSNVYSPGEAVLLAWAGAHLGARFPEHAARLRAFDDELLRSSLPLLALMLNHWPPLEGRLTPGEASKLKKAAAAEQASWPANAALAARLWEALQLPFPLTPAQLLEGAPADGLMLLAYAYQVSGAGAARRTLRVGGLLGSAERPHWG